jgi:p24 family protein delta-1
MNYTSLFQMFVVYLTLMSSIESLMFYLPVNQKKCLKEEIHKDILVKGDYFVSEIVGHHTKLEVLDSKGHILYNKDEATKGKFAFTTDEYDVFQVCFETKVMQDVRGADQLVKEVHLTVKHGVEAKDYENVKIFIRLF